MVTITEDYVSFEIAKLLKEKKFLEPCRHYYFTNGTFARTYGPKHRNPLNVNTYSAPTLQMAMKWLREVHKLHIEPHIQTYKNYNGNIYNLDGELLLGFSSESPEQACEAAIKYCLEYLI